MALVFSATADAQVSAENYRAARAEMVAAYQQEDFPKMYLAARKALAARPEYPGGLYNLALAQTLIHDHRGSLQTLNRLIERGVDFGAVDADEFAALRTLGEWAAFKAKVAALQEPVGRARIVARHAEANFVPEGIAIDQNGHALLGSIRTGEIVRFSGDPEVLHTNGHSWSVFGMRFQSDGSLWFASAAVAQFLNAGDDAGQTGLFRLDLDSGELTRAAILPQYEDEQVLGDLVIADDNVLYTTDSLTGAIYRYYIDSNEFETLVKRGRLGSPQGLVLDRTGHYLYVADYIGGLYRVTLQDGTLAKIRMPDSVTDYGIDGLYRYNDELIVVQNGIRPHRVAGLRLDDNGMAVIESRVLAANLKEFDEPTLGVVRGDDFYFVANSHWNRFDRDNQLPDGLTGPIVLRISLAASPTQ